MDVVPCFGCDVWELVRDGRRVAVSKRRASLEASAEPGDLIRPLEVTRNG